jgi:hypothetical protein
VHLALGYLPLFGRSTDRLILYASEFPGAIDLSAPQSGRRVSVSRISTSARGYFPFPSLQITLSSHFLALFFKGKILNIFLRKVV